MPLFWLFTNNAREVITLAQDDVRLLGHTSHFSIGLTAGQRTLCCTHSSVRFLIDAHLPRSLVSLFTDNGHEAIHVSTLPLGFTTPDSVVTDYADAESFAVVSKDADFINAVQVSSFMKHRVLLLLPIILVSACTYPATPNNGVLGDAAIWRPAPEQSLGAQTESLAVQVQRIGCNDGVTGDVLPPVIRYEEARIIVSYFVSPIQDGVHNCQSNEIVEVELQLSEPLNNRELVDGNCLGTEYESMPLCDGETTWWR